MKFLSWNIWRWALLASFCLNVALISYVSIQWLRPPALSAGLMMPSRLVERIAGRLPSDDADILWGVYRSKQADLTPLQADYLRALTKTLQVVGATNIDKAAVRAAVKDARDQRLLIGDKIIDIFVESLERMSPEARRQLVRGYPR